ncbi:MAG: hypothetical protein WB614_17660, partial [Pseudolabrys sp.]
QSSVIAKPGVAMKQTLALTYRRYKLGNQKEKGLPKGVDGSPWIKMLLALDREPLGVGQQASKLTQNNLSAAVPKHYLLASSEFHLEIQTAGGTYEANSSTHAHTAAWLLQLLLVALHSVTAHTRAHQV